MKKILIITMCLLITMLSMFEASAAGTAKGKISIANITAAQGEKADVIISVDENPGIIAMRFKVKYNSSVLTLRKAENGTVFSSDAAQFDTDKSDSEFIMLWEDGLADKNNTNTGTLATLHFNVKPGAQLGKSDIEIEFDRSSVFDVNLKNVSFTAEKAAVTVTQGSGIFSGKNLITIIISAVAAIAAAISAVIVGIKNKLKKQSGEDIK